MRADGLHLDEGAERLALRGVGEAIEGDGVLADAGFDQQALRTVFSRQRYSDELWIVSVQPRSPWKMLSTKERRIAEMICAGMTARVIADSLGVSVNTVRNQTSSIYRKMGVHNKVELARFAGPQDQDKERLPAEAAD